jgi:phenylpropionate dioxygenase-like ring-hydroxylating dioxygenase large terminal subunit
MRKGLEMTTMDFRSRTQDGGGLRHGLSPQDRRDYIPVLGLREYWYPGIPDKAVGKKPVLVQMLGRDVCFWRGRNGVVAFDNYCPHRGAMMHNGDRWWPGTISCTYHGATFNEEGELLEFIGEGPDSKIVGKMKCETYPTQTVQGVVFIWMGEGEAAPIEEDLPPEFFRDDFKVYNALDTWSCNWRQGIENVADAHAPYVHRNSSMSIWNEISPFPGWPKPEPVNGRGLVRPGNRMRSRDGAGSQRPAKEPYRRYFPRGNFIWPRSRWRLLWTWAFRWRGKRSAKRPDINPNPEWHGAMHLPCMFRGNYRTHLFTRMVVPVDENNLRLFYFHSYRADSLLTRIYEKAHFTIWHDWSMNTNFSGQDGRQMIYQYYDKPEKLSVSDSYTIAWRRLVFQARGMEEPRLEGMALAEEFAEFDEKPETAETLAQTGGA